MPEADKELFLSCLSGQKQYFEFGLGGSTVAAAAEIEDVRGVDSSQAWCDKVKSAAPNVLTHYVDIGKIAHAGRPVDDESRPKWPQYSKAIFKVADRPDLVLIDGRFRVACAAQTLLFCMDRKIQPIVLLHDAWRTDYSAVSTLFRCVRCTSPTDRVGGLCQFEVDLSISPKHARAVFDRFKYDTL